MIWTCRKCLAEDCYGPASQVASHKGGRDTGSMGNTRLDFRKRLDEAFVAFKKLELVLCNEKEASTPNYTFPRTFAEMMARKQAVSEARKTKRASRGIPERR